MAETAVATVVEAPAPAPVPQTESAALISMIERAARDPSVDIDKMQRLFEMHERMQATTAKREFWGAFAVMQPKLPTIGRNGAIKTNEKDQAGNKTGKQVKQSKYALWEDIDEAARPVYTAHGFSLSFRITQTPERLTTTAVLAHQCGHSEETSFSSPIDNSGSKNNVQGWGSAFSYGKRYTGTALLNIVTRGEDDDGKAAGAPSTITEEQVIELRDMIIAVDADEKRFCAHGGFEKLADIPASQFEAAKKMLAAKAVRK